MAVVGASSVLARNNSLILDSFVIANLPSFLCPALLTRRPFARRQIVTTRICIGKPEPPARRYLNHDAPPIISCKNDGECVSLPDSVLLPQQCAGCGALSQTVVEGDPGFYSSSRRSVKEYMRSGSLTKYSMSSPEDQVFEASIQSVNEGILKPLRVDLSTSLLKTGIKPVCDRCHQLLHHHSGSSIHHPSVESIKDTIFESPHKYNHVFHVLDAADFPMSLIPRLQTLLHVNPQRSLNRRSKIGKFYHGRKSDISFIITRSDLLAPLKSQVDTLMPYLVSVLRDALGSIGQDIRLGNVRCVSAKRGWWTKELKEDIWNRGGAGWMVGKVNVGKSQLFECVFPKGRRGSIRLDHQIAKESHLGTEMGEVAPKKSNSVGETKLLNPFSLLPPAQLETDFPDMPLVSSLPGTTASPIRVPFGNGKGELVDLPGLSRGDLELHVQEAHRSSLVMRSRINPEQQVIKPGQSLLIGGFIRITAATPNTIILAYSFTPIESHLTSTEKAVAIQTQNTESGVINISVAGTGKKILRAGCFPLKWDVTKRRSGPITDRSAAGITVDRLPYRVFSTDILIEGCGWVELVAQVRKCASKQATLTSDRDMREEQELEIACPESMWPEVEIFSPEGRFIAARRPMGAWLLGKRTSSTEAVKSRPRQSMKGMKKRKKAYKNKGRTLVTVD